MRGNKELTLKVKFKDRFKKLLTKFLRFLMLILNVLSTTWWLANPFILGRQNKYLDQHYSKRTMNSKTIAMLPYSTFDCELLFSFLDEKVKKLGLESHTIQQKDSRVIRRKIIVPPVPSGRYTYREKLQIFLDIFGDGTNSARGAIDEYRHLASSEELLTASPINAEVWEKIILESDRAVRISEEYDSFIVPDLGYTFNRTLLEQVLAQNKKIFVINPRGFVTDASSVERMPTSSRNTYEIVAEIMENKGTPSTETTQHIPNVKEFSNTLFEKSQNTHASPEWKILFLHCLRDSDSGILPRQDSREIPFLDYLEWTEFAFAAISRNPNNWKIRKHPHGKRFAGEETLINGLINKYSIPKTMIYDQELTLDELVTNSTVFTHSGTIALELAALGKLANCNSTFFPNFLSNQILDKDQIREAFAASPGDCQINKFAEVKHKEIASYCLGLITSENQQVGQACTPKIKLERNCDEFYRTISELKLALKYAVSINSKGSHSALNQIANWISINVNSREQAKDWILANKFEGICSTL